MNTSSKFRLLKRNFTVARIISFSGSSFSEFAIPLFLFDRGASPLHIAMQWVILALARFFSGYFSPHLTFIRYDKTGIVLLDIVQGIAILTPVVFHTSAPIVSCYVATVFISIFSTLQQGFITSLITHGTESETNPHVLKQQMNASIESGRNFGMLFGYAAAFFVSSRLGFQAAFFIDSISFIASALILINTPAKYPMVQPQDKRSYSLLFTPRLKLVTFSQMFLSGAAFLFNGCYIFHLKNDFKASDKIIMMFFITQYLAYAVGGFAASRLQSLSKSLHPWIRLTMAAIFLGFAFTSTSYFFIAWNVILSFLIGISQPAVMVIFQESVAPSQQRSMGSARTAVVSIVGAVGAALSGFLLEKTEAQFIFILASVVSLISALIFAFYVRDLKDTQST
jgi:predicted MFS family arabinose efflux permease